MSPAILGNYDTPGGGWSGMAIAGIEDVAGTINLAEIHWMYSVFASQPGAIVRSVANATDTQANGPSDANIVGFQRAGTPNASHFDGYNYLFVDGHVKWLKPERTVGAAGTLSTPQGMWTLNPND